MVPIAKCLINSFVSRANDNDRIRRNGGRDDRLYLLRQRKVARPRLAAQDVLREVPLARRGMRRETRLRYHRIQPKT
jgi:hypothetical protein